MTKVLYTDIRQTLDIAIHYRLISEIIVCETGKENGHGSATYLVYYNYLVKINWSLQSPCVLMFSCTTPSVTSNSKVLER